mgnify:CR=1 FL=1
MEAILISFLQISIYVHKNGIQFINFLRRKIATAEDGDIIIYKNRDRLTAKDLRSMYPTRWLTERCVNFLIREVTLRIKYAPICVRTDEGFQISKDRVFPDYIKALITNSRIERLVLIPMYHMKHYTLFSIDRKSREISFYDSLTSATPTFFPATMFEKIKAALIDLDDGYEIVDGKAWEFIEAEVRQQYNGFDCSIHVLQHARYADKDNDRKYCQEYYPEEISSLREKLLPMILEDTLWADEKDRVLKITSPIQIINNNDEDDIMVIENKSETVVAVPAVPVQKTWINARSMKEIFRKYGDFKTMTPEFKKNSKVLKRWLAGYRYNTNQRFNFNGRVNRLRIKKILKKIKPNK